MATVSLRASIVTALGAVCTATLASTAALAQSGGLDEIIVSAQRRAENLQDVPIAVTAFSASALEERGISNVTDITHFTPNVHIDRGSPFGGSSTIMGAFIRGIGQTDFAFNMEPGVGLYVDGVYYARTVGAAVDLLDVDRMEVLKGPQGTLFGRNTIGGAIHVVTRRPADEFGFSAEATVGRFDRLDLKASADIPVVDGLLYSSLAFSSNEQDGFQRRIPFDPTAIDVVNPVSGQAYTQPFFETDSERFLRARTGVGGDRQGGENSRSGRLKLLFTPSDDFEFTLAADVTHAREESTASTLLAVNGFAFPFTLSYNACIDGVDPSTLVVGPPYPTFALAGICDITRGPLGTALADVQNRLPYGEHFITDDIDTTYSRGSNFADVTTWGVSGTAEWHLNDTVTLKSITAYRELDSVFGLDLSSSPEAMLDVSITMNQEQFSQELQFNVDAFDNRLRSVVGAYYFTEKGELIDTVTFSAGLLQVLGPNDLKNEAWALFAHNNFAVTDRLGLTFGVRYTEETKAFTGGQRDLSGFTSLFVTNFGFPPEVFPDPNDPTRLFPLDRNRVRFSDSSVRAGLEYRLATDVLGYVSYAQGFKSGGFTTRLGAPLVVSSIVSGGVTDPVNPPQHGPEKADTYELGLKSELLNRRLRLNTALFWSDYKDIQVVSAPAFTFGAPWFFNAGDARIRGFEIEGEALVTDDFIFNAGIGYLDARYRNLGDIATAGGLTEHTMLVNAPDWTVSAGGTYTFRLPDSARLLARADYAYRSRTANNEQNTPLLVQDGFSLVNASLTYEPGQGNWQLALGGDNLTNRRYLVTGNDNPAVGAISGTYNRPRTWYVTFRIRG